MTRYSTSRNTAQILFAVALQFRAYTSRHQAGFNSLEHLNALHPAHVHEKIHSRCTLYPLKNSCDYLPDSALAPSTAFSDPFQESKLSIDSQLETQVLPPQKPYPVTPAGC
jgi:hypothetical protein